MRGFKVLLYSLGAAAGALYLVNPTAGVFELLPDNLPFVGNLDEALFTALFIESVRRLRRTSKAGAARATD